MIKMILTMIVFFIVAIVMLGAIASKDKSYGPLPAYTHKEAKPVAIPSHSLSSIYKQVLQDSIDQYNIVVHTDGSDIDLYVSSGLVMAAALQAKDTNTYAAYKIIRDGHATAAGIVH